MTICEKIDCIIKAKNMSRRQLALRAGIAPSSLQSALQRNRGLSTDMLNPICKALELPITIFEMTEGLLKEWKELLVDQIESAENALSRPCAPDDITNLRESLETSKGNLVAVLALLDEMAYRSMGESEIIEYERKVANFVWREIAKTMTDTLHEEEVANAIAKIKEILWELNETGQTVAIDRIRELAQIPKYRRFVCPEDQQKDQEQSAKRP